MEATFAVLRKLREDGVLGDFAIGGAMAAMFYAEPVLTYDLDVFVALQRQGALLTLSPLYEALRQQGYEPSGECVDIEGVPVQFLPAASPLIEEAMRDAVELPYGAVTTRVMRPEHLIAICLQTGRPKDRDRVRLLAMEAELNNSELTALLERHGLCDRWKQWTA
ncbi:MAG: hypothetical protein GF331_16845 [Chitinivibrionales bacterium]|nr:hypothetical protein [Chitinivibrionales bacterium]